MLIRRFVFFILFTVLLPSSPTVLREMVSFYGNFSWSAADPVRLSAGDFDERVRSSAKYNIPKMRLLEYEVRKGETLWSIAKEFDIDPDSIISCNAFINVHRIREGDRIFIPNMRGIFVNVKKGDTLLSLSEKHKIPPDIILEANELRSNLLEPGMKVFLPGARYSNIERAYALGVAFEKPARGRLTSRFGHRKDPFSRKRTFHTGIDIASRLGTEVYAARDGTVSFSGMRLGMGKSVTVEHTFGYKTVYSHLSVTRVSKGDKVKTGEIIGFIGESGRSTGPHLHFEVWHRNRLIDPLTQTNMSSR